MSRKIEPLSVTLKSIIEILHKVNTTEDRAELIGPLLVDIEGMLVKLSDSIEKVYWEGLGDDSRALSEEENTRLKYLVNNPPTTPRSFS